jgi:transcriptional regulator with XRE-family HTH domain
MAKRRGIHLDELAERAGLSRTVFYTLNDPKVSTAKALADALGVTVDRLIREEPASKRTARKRSA